MAKVTVELGSTGYRLRVGEEVTEFVDYGDPLEATIGGKLYGCFMDLPDGMEDASEVESMTDHDVYEMTPVSDCETVEIEEDEDEEDEDEDEGVEGEEGEEEIQELKV